MSSTFVTLAEVLEARGGPLEEEEVWSLLLGSAETLLDVSYRGHNNICNVISPASLLLSATGMLAFKNCAMTDEVSTFTAPEMLQGRTITTKLAMEKVTVYSLGMTLYWSVDYNIPQNQPIQLSDSLNCLLLSMCEDMAHRRVSLNSILEACETHHKSSVLPPPNKVIKQLVEDIIRNQTDQTSLTDNTVHLSGRTQMIRERLHGKRGPYPGYAEGSATTEETQTRRLSLDSDSKPASIQQQKSWSLKNRTTQSPSFQGIPNRIPRGPHHRGSNSSWLSRSQHLNTPHKDDPKPQSLSITVSESSASLAQRKTKSLGPEFTKMIEEPQIILELPGSIVSKKGKSCSSQREVSVIMPNEQCVLVKCDIKSRGRDVFDMVVAHANLVEHFYFGLAFIDDDEFFFLDPETKISKVAPDTWKKLGSVTFTLFLRVKFFPDDISFILHRLTRHQYYLQTRKDILEDRLHCNEETALFLAALALQAEFGDYMPEVYGKSYFQIEHYVSKRAMEKMALPCLREDLPRLHANNAHLLPEEAELEFLKITQQLPEYGVLFHRVAREKKSVIGELVLGICAKGIVVYEVKNHSRIFCRRFQWSETDSISTARRKLTIECGPSGKKHTFVTESSKIAQYLLNLCSAQHKFHSEMTSRQLTYCLASDDNIAKYTSICQSQHNQMKRLSCSETVLNTVGLNALRNNSMSKSCDDLSANIEARLRQQRELREIPEPRALSELKEQSQNCSPTEAFSSPIYRVVSNISLQKQDSEAHSTSSSIRVDTPVRSPPEREIICVTLKKDPKFGFGFIIVGEDNTGKLDLGIFIASVVPDGPADKDGRIRPGGRLISLNKISLEGVTFSAAAAILQNSPDEVELIVSQPKQGLRDSKSSLAPSVLGTMLERGFDSQTTLSTEYRPLMEELEEALSNIMTPKAGRKIPIPVVRVLDTQASQDACSRSLSFSSLNPAELVYVELKKVNGSLGISVAGGINTNVRYGGIYIKSLVVGGAAELDGRIQIGDRLLEVDGSNLRGVTHRQAVECLKKTGEVVSLLLERESPVVLETSSASSTMERQRSRSFQNTHCTSPLREEVAVETSLSVKAKDYSFVSDDNTIQVTLKKSLSGLGFSFLITEPLPPDEGSLVRIKRLFSGQPADQSGLIREGDVILAINGETVKGLSYQRVLNLLRDSPLEVRLTLCRPAPGALPLMDATALNIALSHAREVRSKSLDMRAGHISAEFSELLKLRSLERSSKRLCSLERTEEVQVNNQSMNHPQEGETPSTPSTPPSPPSPKSSSESGEQEEEVEGGAPGLVTATSVANTTMTTTTSVSTTPATALTTTTATGVTTTMATSASVTTATAVATTTAAAAVATVTATAVSADTVSAAQQEFKDQSISNSNHNSAYISGNGSTSYCLMANGLTILADEEYLTITTTSASPPDSSATGSGLTVPLAQPPPPPPSTPLAPAMADAPSSKNNHSWDDEEEDDEDPRKDMMKEFELTVSLTKSWNGSFGFTITRSKLDNCYYVQDVLDNPAKADGRLRAGDRLITVNNHNLTNVTDDIAMSILKCSTKRLTMVLGRAVQNLLPPPSPDSLPDIVLHKTPSGQLGIKLTGGIGSKWQGIYVLEVVPASPASEEGSIQPQDKILYICGKCTMGMTLEDAVKACENAPRKVKLKAIREDQPVTPRGKWNGLFDWKKDKKFLPRFEDSSPSEVEVTPDDVKAVPESSVRFRQRLSVTSEQESCIIQVEFTKPERGGLGFALVGGANGSALRVKDICCGGAAEQDGRLRVGDILLEVNGVIVSGLSHGKVVDILRKAEGTVQLTVCRDILSVAGHAHNPPADSSHDNSAHNPTEVNLDSDMQRDLLNFQASGCSAADSEDSRNCTPTCQRCCPTLCVTDMLQDRIDPQKQHQENRTMKKEQNHSDGWSSDDEDDDDDTFQPSSPEITPHTDRPIVSEEELASLAMINPSKTGRYSGARIKALIQVLQHQLEQQDLVKEFMALEHLKPSDNCLVGKAPENREKNRYRDILPYDKTRVPVGEKQDYINASYIRMEVGSEEFLYISSQGPLPSTQDSFWQMVWEHKSDVIAMMTQEVERGRVKCHKYWPEKLGVPVETDRYQLILDNYQMQDYFHIKIIKMVEKESGEVHFVKHLKFTTWPDHGTPRSSEQLVRFIRYMRAVHFKGPVTVHCSAGIGRAGVLICIDVILSLIEKDLTINVSEIVREMRLQRYGMIQTKEQYLFCYRVWLDVLQSILLLHGNQWQSETP